MLRDAYTLFAVIDCARRVPHLRVKLFRGMHVFDLHELAARLSQQLPLLHKIGAATIDRK